MTSRVCKTLDESIGLERVVLSHGCYTAIVAGSVTLCCWAMASIIQAFIQIHMGLAQGFRVPELVEGPKSFTWGSCFIGDIQRNVMLLYFECDGVIYLTALIWIIHDHFCCSEHYCLPIGKYPHPLLWYPSPLYALHEAKWPMSKRMGVTPEQKV